MLDERRLVFLQHTDKRTNDGHKIALFKCVCGECVEVAASRVRNGYTRSCGCLGRENKPNLTHGGHGSPTYSSWASMKDRCLNPSSKDYARWGGRGISISPEWAGSFYAFLRDMGERPTGTTIDRIDADKGYHPGNCRWATPKQQARNRRDLVVVQTAQGPIPLVDYAAQLGISKGAAHLRLKRGKLEGVS